MKSALNNTIGDFIVDQIDGSSSAPIIKTEYFSDTQSTWREIPSEFIESRTINLSSVNDRYQVHSFVPPIKTMDLMLNNFDHGWNDDGARAGIIAKNRLIRCSTGLNMPLGTNTLLTDDFATGAKFVNTVKSGSLVTSDITPFSGTIATAAELGVTYGTGATYGSAVYGHLGYYTKTFNLPESGDNEARHFNINVNSNNFSLKYRVGNDSAFIGSPWYNYRALTTGANSMSLTADDNQNFIQYIIRFEGNTYGVDNLNSAVLNYSSKAELFKQGTFILDQPKFNDKVKAQGRDYLRKALETEINIPAVSNQPITTTLTKVFDRCSIPYDTATWNLTATTISLTTTAAESFNNTSAYKVTDKLMTALNAGNDDWKFAFKDGQATINILPTATEADALAHYFFHIEQISKDLDSDRQLQRVTAVNKDIIVESESLLKSATGAATSALSITYADSLYVRYEDNNNTILTETARTNGSVSLSMSTGSGYDIDVYGCVPKNAITTEVWGEKGNAANILSNDGNTHKAVNEFLTATMAQDLCNYLITKNGSPAKRVQTVQLMNPLVELDDNFLIFARETSDNTIFGLQKITESWTNPGLKHKLEFVDKGVVFENFVWDRDGYNPGVEDNKYDTSLIWEYDLGVNATADNTSYNKPVRMA